MWGIVLAVLTSPVATASGSPNIIFLLADDMGFGDLGVNGQNARAAAGLPAIATPNIDALAAKSLSFTRMYSTPLCSPSRASMLTGFEIHNLKRDSTDSTEGLRAGEQDKTWAQMLQQHGYKTAMYGKWHLGGVDWPGGALGVYDYNAIPTQKGFEVVYGHMAGGYRTVNLWENDGSGGLKLSPNQYTPSWPGPGLPYKFTEDAQTDRVVKLIEDSASVDPRPFAAYVAFQAPHEPFHMVDLGDYADETWPLVQRQYAALMANLDQNVGRIIAAVEDPNGDGDKSDSIAANTIIMFGSDNGPLWNHSNGYRTEDFNSNGPFRGEKSNTLEGGIRTPFFVRWDGVAAPGVNDEHVGSYADIFPTFAELMGVKPPVGVDGVSMLASITGQGRVRQQDAHLWTARFDFNAQAGWAIQMGDWKLIRRPANASSQLYHISEDPYETTNLAATRTDIRDALAAVAELEGVGEEPFFATGNHASPVNIYYTQYKTWAPQDGSTTFNLASNWAGGTQFNRTNDPESLYWNTGPKKNWLATVANTTGGFRNSFVLNNMKVMALDIQGGAGVMQVSVLEGARLDAYNGVRVGDDGIFRLVSGTLATAREVDVEAGGSLAGAGTITGYQSIVAGIPEFQGKNLLTPEVVNAGLVDPYGDTAAGLITIDGDFWQLASGQFRVDVMGGGGVAGVDYDKLIVAGAATLSGSIYIDVSDGFTPADGQLFPVLSAASLSLANLQLAGPDAGLFNLSVLGGADLVLTVGPPPSGDFDGNGVVDGDDLLAWKQSYGQAPGGADGNHDGRVDGGDFLLWQQQLGNGTAALGAASRAVPEPTAMVLALGILPLVAAARRSRRAPFGRS
ncbi:MAG: hypothetical protein DCC67_05450 [Planctomycetota bacterium]|nr:MAG: hypothetical protein DCC67_05450 [Planctomycetota bacterium]